MRNQAIWKQGKWKQRALCIAFALGFAVLSAAAQEPEDKSKRPSPPAHTACKFADGKTIAVDYSSPRRRGRKIFGGLVPYGEVWRAGANEATTFVTNVDLTVGGKAVRAGSYTIFTLPNADKWLFIISKQTDEWGIPYPGAEYDLLRADMKLTKLPSTIQNFAIGFDQAGATCTLRMDWETTRASIEISEKK